MTPTRIPTLIAVAVAVGFVTWLVLWFTYLVLPPLPWTAVPTLMLLAAAETITAFNVRARIRGRRGSRPVEPMGVARMAALGKATAYMAAVVAGLCAGYFGYVAGSLGKETPRHDAIVSGATLGAAVVLAGVALFLERCCRVPKPPEEQDSSRRS